MRSNSILLPRDAIDAAVIHRKVVLKLDVVGDWFKFLTTQNLNAAGMNRVLEEKSFYD